VGVRSHKEQKEGPKEGRNVEAEWEKVMGKMKKKEKRKT
jgi:hypothetical protein